MASARRLRSPTTSAWRTASSAASTPSAPLAGLPVGQPEIVIGLGGAPAIAQALVGQQRASIERGGLVEATLQMSH